MIFTALYTQTIEPLSCIDAISFVWISQILLPLLPWSVDKEVENQIKNGNIAYELARPIDLYQLLFCKSFAIRIAPMVFHTPLLAITAALFFGLGKPLSLDSFLAFLLSVLFGALLSTAITTLITISLFWTLAGDGIGRILPQTALFFSGTALPLPLFPNFLQPFFNVQPFRGVIDIPCRLYTGLIPSSEALFPLCFQLAWTLVFICLGKLLLKCAQKRIVIQGG